MALRANRPSVNQNLGGAPGTGSAPVGGAAQQQTYAASPNTQAGGTQPQYQATEVSQQQYQPSGAQQPQYQQQYQQPVSNAQQYSASGAPATVTPGGAPSAVVNLNGGILENIDGMDSMGNFVSMDGSDFLYKATDERKPFIDLIVSSGKRYYQYVDETDPNNKVFHDSPTRLNDNYKLKFEIHWEEDGEEEGEVVECQFHMPTASAMRFIDYVKLLASSGYGVGSVVTHMTISRQTNKKDTTKRYSRAEFTMIGYVDQNNNIVPVQNGPTTVGKQ